MNVLSETKTLLEGLSIPVETGVFEGTAPEMYVVIVPLTDSIVRSLLASDFTITDRRYIERENDTGYHHYAIDVAKIYELED